MATYQYKLNAYNKKHLGAYNKSINSYSKTVDDYHGYVEQFKPSKLPDVKIGSDTVEAVSSFLTNLNKRNYNYLDIDNQRTNLDRVFDALQVGQYVTQGALMGIIDDKLTVWEGMTQGLRASNPFGDGKDKWEYSFSDVLGKLGWNPETTGGKITKGAVGIVGDIFLDPLTYVSGGLSALAKGTGKASVKLATKGNKLVDLLGDAGKFIDNIDELQDVYKMTDEMAEAIIKNSSTYAKNAGKIDVASDAKRLAKKYNQLVGAHESSDVIFSLANAPLGKKIFRGLADKQFKLFSDAGLRKIGDETFAPVFARMRHEIVGGKIGKLFNTNHALYKLASKTPETVYTHMKWMDAVYSSNIEKTASLAEIRKYAIEVAGLTPKEAQEVLELMQDASKWTPIKKAIKFIDTQEAEEYKSKIRDLKKKTEDTLTKWRVEKEHLQKTQVDLSDEFFKSKNVDEALKKQYAEEIYNMDTKFITDMEDMDLYISKLEQATTYIEKQTKKIPYDPNSELMKQYELYKGLSAENLKLKDLKPEELSDLAKNTKKALRNATKPEGMSSTTFSRVKKALLDDGYVSYKRGSKYVDAFEETIGEGWKKVIQTDGTVRFYPPEEFSEGLRAYRYTRDVDATKAYSEFRANKEAFVNELSTNIFGQSGFISPKIWEKDLDALVDFMKTHNREEIVEFILENRSLYSGKTSRIFEFIGKEFGYGGNYEYKTWDDYYNGQLDKLYALKDTDKYDAQKIMNLHKEKMRRSAMIRLFDEAHTLDDVEAIISTLKNEGLEEWNRLIDDVWEAQRKEFLKNSGQKTVGSYFDKPKPTEKAIENRGVDFNLTPQHRQMIKEYFIDKTATVQSNKAFNYNLKQFKDKMPMDKTVFNKYTEYDSINTKIQKSKKIIDNIDKTIARLQDLRVKNKAGVSQFANLQEHSTILNRVAQLRDMQTFNKNKIAVLAEKQNALRNEIISLVTKQTGVPTDASLKMYDQIADELELILKERNMQFGNLSETERAIFLDEAARRHNSRLNKKSIDEYGNLVEGGKGIVDKETAKSDIQKALEKRVKRYADEARARGEFDNSRSIDNYEVYNGVVTNKVKAPKDPSLLARKNSVVEVMYEGKPVEGYVFKDYMLDGKKRFDVFIEVDGKKITHSTSIINDYKGQRMPRNLDELAMSRPMIDDFLKRAEDLVGKYSREVDVDVVKTNDAVVSKLDEMRQRRSDFMQDSTKTRMDVIMRFEDSIQKNMEQGIEIEKSLKSIRKQVDAVGEKLDKFAEEYELSIKRFDMVLNNNEAFMNYLYNQRKFGVMKRSDIDELMANYNEGAGWYVLDPDLDLDSRVKTVAEAMREKFQKIGFEEVEINKLLSGQLEANEMDYLPHILTPEGEEFFLNKDITKTIQGFGDVAGFGTEYNNFAKSRTITKIPDGFGGWIDKPTIEQLNSYFKQYTGGKNVFSEDLHEIYIARAQKHIDLMYDDEYMENMIKVFGKEYNGVLDEGHELVINYGKAKQYYIDLASRNVALDIQEEIGFFLDNNETKQKIATAVYKVLEDPKNILYESEIKAKVTNEVVQEFVTTNFTDDVRKAMKEEYVTQFLDSTNMRGALDDVSMPLLQVDDNVIKGSKIVAGQLQARYMEKIIKDFARFSTRQGEKYDDVYSRVYAAFNNGLIDIDDIKKAYKGAIETANNANYAKLTRMLKRIDDMENVPIFEVGQVQQSIVQKANQARQLQIMKDNNQMLQFVDRFTHFIKVNQTAVMPAFHTRNKLANMFNNWLAIGADAYDVDLQKKIYKGMKFKSGEATADEFIEVMVGGKKQSVSMSELIDMAHDYGVIDKGIFAVEIGTDKSTKGALSKILPGKFDPTNMKEFVPYKLGTSLGTNIENHDRLVHFISLVRRGVDAREASESVAKFLFDYSDLTTFESSVMKRIFPYYTWLRKNGALQLEQMLEQPEKYRFVAKVLGGVRGMVPPEDRINKAFVNEFALDWIQTPFSVENPQGRQEPILWNPNLPFMDISRIPNPLDPIGTVKDLFTQSNPLIKIPYEVATNRNVFFEQPLAEEGESRILSSLGHAANQMAVVPAVTDLIEKKGVDIVLHALNITSGLKFLSYDYEAYKAMRIQEMLKEGKSRRPNIVGNIAKGIVKGFDDAMSYATTKGLDAMHGVADSLNASRPMNPDEYVGALRPISEATYNSLGARDKLKYIPPTKEEGAYINQQAQMLSEKAYQETGIMKKFVWTLLDASNLGTTNGEYQMGKVLEVKDGDTISVDVAGEKKDVRIYLVDSPETAKEWKNQDSEPFADEAKQFGQDVLFDKDVKLFIGGVDSNNRVLAYVEVEGKDYAEELLNEGMAQYRYDIDDYYRRKPTYLEAESKAYQSKKGIWSLQGYASPRSDNDYNMNVDMSAYNEFKKRKMGEILQKKTSVNTNKSGFDRVLELISR